MSSPEVGVYGKQWGAVPGVAGIWAAGQFGVWVPALVAAVLVLALVALVGLRFRRVERADRR